MDILDVIIEKKLKTIIINKDIKEGTNYFDLQIVKITRVYWTKTKMTTKIIERPTDKVTEKGGDETS